MNEDHLYLPTLIKFCSSEDSDKQREFESHVTSGEPLGLLKISWNKKPFSGPYVLFKRIFGSKIYLRSDKFLPNLSFLHHGTVTSAWTVPLDYFEMEHFGLELQGLYTIKN